MRLNGIHHIGINVRNLNLAEAFYTDVLGFKVEKRYEEKISHSMLNTGTIKIHLFESPSLDTKSAIACLSEEGYAHIAFGTDRRHFPQIMQELKKQNISFRGPIILGNGESIHFQDPDSNHLEIRCPVDLKSNS